MGIITGLKDINAKIEADEARNNGEATEKAKWFKLDAGESTKVVFLQEFDEDSENYSKKNGLGFIATEHSSPQDFKRKALCTRDDDTGAACWACEQHRKSYQTEGDNYKGGWKQRSRMYINALVVKDKEEPYVAILSQGLSGRQITPALLEQAGEIGTITDKYFKIKRVGAKLSDTNYLLTPLGAHDLDVESYDLHDLKKYVREVPYEEQAAYYNVSSNAEGQAEPAGAAAFTGGGSVSTDDEW